MTSVSRAFAAGAGIALGGAALLHLQAAAPQTAPAPRQAPPRPAAVAPAPALQSGVAYRAVLDKYCVTCHNERLHTANLTLDKLDLDQVGDHAEVWEKVVNKLRARTMPPARSPRPDEATYDGMASWIEGTLDRAALLKPNPGAPTLHRLNRAEYTNAIRDLLGLEIDGSSLLPPDASGYGFDNNGDVLSLSPLLMEQYIMAAQEISRMALGDPTFSPYVQTYNFSKAKWQIERASEDLPFGTRGGAAFSHYFSLDGEYSLRIRLRRSLDDRGIRGIDREEKIDVRIDDDLIKTFSIGKDPLPVGNALDDYRALNYGDPVYDRHIYNESADDALVLRFPIKAGAHKVGVSFLDNTGALYEGLGPQLFPVGSQSNVNDDANLMQIDAITIGPASSIGAGDTPSRKMIFSCKPANAAAEEGCAKTILSGLARRAYRRTATPREVDTLMSFFRSRRDEGFEVAVGAGIRRILVSPTFLFRLESDPLGASATVPHRINDVELASRLSFFLWSSIPDEELLSTAEQGRLKDPKVLEQQVRRMLADRRSSELMRNFGGQWLLLRNVKFATPDPYVYPEWDDNLREALQRETELFLDNLQRTDRSVLDFVDANYTFVNEELAKHYGIPNVYGEQYRKVTFPDNRRGGLLGMGSIQLVTSQATRTSPVQRGKWVLENLLGTPPPAPPANVPPFPDNGDMSKLSVRERMELHRKNPVCASCHSNMDPLGFAMENFDGVGKWRTTEGGKPIDASGTLPDGSAFSGPAELRKLVLRHQDQFVQTLTRKLMTYALGRGVEYYDGPAVRKVAREATPDYRWSSIVLGIVKSVPFQQRLAPDAKPERATAQSLN